MSVSLGECVSCWERAYCLERNRVVGSLFGSMTTAKSPCSWVHLHVHFLQMNIIHMKRLAEVSSSQALAVFVNLYLLF